MEPKVESYPIFQDNQVLTAGQLNQLVGYLESQERYTRNKLIGIGLACGLNLQLLEGGQVIEIGSGVGVTSEGYLITLAGLTSEPLVQYRYFTEFVFQENERYTYFLNGETPIPMYRLRETKINGAEPFSELPNPLTGYVAVLYLRCLDLDLKNCLEFDCDERGGKRQFELIPLLITREDARRIIYREEQADLPVAPSDLALDQLVNARFWPRPVRIPRFRLDGRRLDTYQDLYQVYEDLINASIPLLQNAVLQSYSFYRPLLRGLFPDQGAISNRLTVTLPGLFNGVKQVTPYAFQYLYDLLCDLADAHNEFLEAAFDVYAACCPPADRFPKHLRLGELTATADCKPSPYRHRWLPAPIHNEQNERKEAMLTLFGKVLLLIDTFTNPALLFRTQKITPSRALDFSLSEKAIPFYYPPTEALLRHWNPDLRRKCRHRENLSYHAEMYAANPAIPSVLFPLHYSLKRCGFFRIEGHLGKNYLTALEEILRIRDRENLAFDVVALKIGRDATGTGFDDLHCSFRDLEVICEAWQKELECLSKDTLSGLTNVNVSGTLKVPPPTVATPVFVTGANLFFSSTQPPLVDRVVETAVPKEEDTVGKYVNLGFASRTGVGEQYANQALVQMQRDYADLFQLPKNEFEIGFRQPIEVATGLIAFLERIQGKCSDLDINDLDQAHKRLLEKARAYLKALNEYVPTDNSKIAIDKVLMIRLMSVLISSCSLEQLRVIIQELNRRKEELLRMNLLSEYVIKNPGIDHAAGTPKGGTFILVYYDRDKTDNPRQKLLISGSVFRQTLTGRITFADGEILPGIVVLEKGTSRGAVVDVNGQFTFFVTKLPMTLVLKYTGLDIPEVVITSLKFELVLDLSGGVSPDAPPPRTVIADFYLPYTCCSDCPSIDYILPPAMPAVSLMLEPREFCVPADGSETDQPPFTVMPEGGAVAGPGVAGTAADGFRFAPAQALGTANQVTVSGFSVNGQAVPLEVRIYRTPVPGFSFETAWRRRDDGTTVFHLALINESSPYGTEWIWEVPNVIGANGEVVPLFTLISRDLRDRPEFDLQVEPDAEFTVKLTAKNGPCEAAVTQTVSTGAPTVALDLSPREFCQRGNQRPEFSVQPENGKVTGPGVEQNAAGKFIFNPDAVAVTALQTVLNGYSVNGIPVPGFSVTVYQQPIADFGCSVQWESTNDGKTLSPRLILQNRSRNAAKYGWVITEEQTGIVLKFEEVNVNFLLAEIAVQEPVQLRFKVELTAVNGPCSNQKVDECLTTAIFIRIFQPDGSLVEKFEFSNQDDRSYLLVIEPGQGKLQLLSELDLQRKERLISPARNEYLFSPFGQKALAYRYNYLARLGGERAFTILIADRGGIVTPDPIIRVLTTDLRAVESLASQPLFNTTLNRTAPAYRETDTVLRQLVTDLADPAGNQEWRAGNQNERFAASMEKATGDAVNRILSFGGARGNTKEQDFLLSLFRTQLGVIMRLTGLLTDDIKATDPVSKLLTLNSKQVKELKGKGVEANAGNGLSEVVEKAAGDLSAKPNAQKQVDKLLSTIKE